MKVFAEFLANLEKSEQRQRLQEVLDWVQKTFPYLEPRVSWNQPMFTDHGTFIIGFSAAKHHFAVAPEQVCIARFSESIRQANYQHTKEIFRIRWDELVDYSLLARVIAFNIEDKADCATFWRK